MTPTVFYSWQSDGIEKHNRFFIRDAIEKALKKLKADNQLEEALRLDHDSNGVPGTPDIISTILEKIAETEIAVFDITPVGRAGNSRPRIRDLFAKNEGKALPNPNVLLELGFASHAIGWKRIVTVMNTAGGFRPDELPFDIRHRRFPIQYCYSGGDKTTPLKKLTDDLAQAIQATLAEQHSLIQRAINRMNSGCFALLDAFGKQTNFAVQGNQSEHAIDRLLELGVINCDVDPSQNLFSYHWTHLGKRVCDNFHTRKAPIA